MVKPLSFKGDKKTKKRKREARDVFGDDEGRSTSKLPAPESAAHEADKVDADNDDSWVAVEAVTDLAGPAVFVLPTTPFSALATDANGTIFASRLENIVSDDPHSAEPHDVRQVWVANRVAGTESFSLKGHHGHYLGCDKFGIMRAVKEAIGPEESWNLVPIPDSPGTFALLSQREKFVQVDEDQTGDTSKAQIRGDSEELQFRETLRVRMQARFKPRLKAKKEETALQKISRQELEEAVGRRLDDDEVKKLKRARRDGSYHETLLDIKVKGKHDKFA